MFQVERVGNVYMLRNSEVTVGELQLSSTLKFMVMKQLETMMVSNLDIQLYPQSRLGLGAHMKVQIVTLMVEQILINHVWNKEIAG